MDPAHGQDPLSAKAKATQPSGGMEDLAASLHSLFGAGGIGAAPPIPPSIAGLGHGESRALGGLSQFLACRIRGSSCGALSLPLSFPCFSFLLVLLDLQDGETENDCRLEPAVPPGGEELSRGRMAPESPGASLPALPGLSPPPSPFFHRAWNRSGGAPRRSFMPVPLVPGHFPGAVHHPALPNQPFPRGGAGFREGFPNSPRCFGVPFSHDGPGGFLGLGFGLDRSPAPWAFLPSKQSARPSRRRPGPPGPGLEPGFDALLESGGAPGERLCLWQGLAGDFRAIFFWGGFFGEVDPG